MRLDNTALDAQNRETLRRFIADAEKNRDDLSGSVIATMTQFLMNLRLAIQKPNRTWVTPEELINAQVQELRNCVVDLEAYKNRILEGVTHQ